MRLKMILQLKKPLLPLDYRPSFISLFKFSFSRSAPEVYSQFYESGPQMKPFTFALSLPDPVFGADTIALGAPRITLNFSTSLPELGVYFYNAMISLRGQWRPLPNDNGLKLLSVHRTREAEISEERAVFRTLSPFLVRRHDRAANSDRYLTSEDPHFAQELESLTSHMLLKLAVISAAVRFQPVKMAPPPMIRHLDQWLRGNRGIFTLTGPAAALDFIRCSGLGARRAEGFGMLELLA